eukprot:TRINITY_DN7703_c0_g1_i1.p1 TRINITY_DN7703_c0_g1~~TRINITY_DN7703_c0_g1_i1.p1  ORF type:complete len:702 (-),score=85.40 TRINITY_DN7703_c0_g1_i1:378-2483(-)
MSGQIFGPNAPDSRKTVECRFFVLGKCKYGESCPFKHDEEKRKEFHKYDKYIECKFHLQGRCAKGDKCPFLHRMLSKPVPAPTLQKPQQSLLEKKDSLDGGSKGVASSAALQVVQTSGQQQVCTPESMVSSATEGMEGGVEQEPQFIIDFDVIEMMEVEFQDQGEQARQNFGQRQGQGQRQTQQSDEFDMEMFKQNKDVMADNQKQNSHTETVKLNDSIVGSHFNNTNCPLLSPPLPQPQPQPQMLYGVSSSAENIMNQSGQNGIYQGGKDIHQQTQKPNNSRQTLIDLQRKQEKQQQQICEERVAQNVVDCTQPLIVDLTDRRVSTNIGSQYLFLHNQQQPQNEVMTEQIQHDTSHVDLTKLQCGLERFEDNGSETKKDDNQEIKETNESTKRVVEQAVEVVQVVDGKTTENKIQKENNNSNDITNLILPNKKATQKSVDVSTQYGHTQTTPTGKETCEKMNSKSYKLKQFETNKEISDSYNNHLSKKQSVFDRLEFTTQIRPSVQQTQQLSTQLSTDNCKSEEKSQQKKTGAGLFLAAIQGIKNPKSRMEKRVMEDVPAEEERWPENGTYAKPSHKRRRNDRLFTDSRYNELDSFDGYVRSSKHDYNYSERYDYNGFSTRNAFNRQSSYCESRKTRGENKGGAVMDRWQVSGYDESYGCLGQGLEQGQGQYSDARPYSFAPPKSLREIKQNKQSEFSII